MAEVESAPYSGLNGLTELIIGAAIEVHRATGPGLLESVYEECLCYELSQRGLKFTRQVELPISYKAIKLNSGFRMDLVVEDSVVLELKTVEELLPIHSAQLLTYLKLSGKTLGLLINFNEPTLKRGLKRLTTARESDKQDATGNSGFGFLKAQSIDKRPLSVISGCRARFKALITTETQRHREVRKANLQPNPYKELFYVISVPSVLSDFDFLTSLCLCVSVVNNVLKSTPVRASLVNS